MLNSVNYSQPFLFKTGHFSTYGEMIRRTNVFGPEEFNEAVAKRVASKIVSLQRTLNRPVNITIAPGRTIIPILGRLAESGTVEKSFLIDSVPKVEQYIEDVFKNPEEERLVFNSREKVLELIKKMDQETSKQFLPFYLKNLPYMIDWKNVLFFHSVELFEKPFFQYREIMKSWFFTKLPKCNCIPESNIFSIDTKKFSIYPSIISQHGGIDVGVFGIGMNSHIAFNEPGNELLESIYPVKLEKETIEHLKPLIPDIEVNPTAITLSTQYIINNIRRIFVVASGKNKSQAIKKSFFDENATPTSKSIREYPAFALRFHPDTVILLDTEAASGLKESDRRAIEEVQGDIKTTKTMLEELNFKEKFSEEQIREMEKAIIYKYLGYTISAKDLQPILKSFLETNLSANDFENYVENAIFDFYKKNALTELLNVDKRKKKGYNPFEKQKLDHVFRNILRVFRFPYVAHRVAERKKLLSDMILKDVIAKAYLPTASEMRKNLAIETIFKHAIQHQSPSNYLIALETIFELIARQLKEGSMTVFFAFLPLVKKAEDLLRTSQLLLELLLKAKHKKVELFYKDNLNGTNALDTEEFFNLSCKIFLMIASSFEKLNEALIEYLTAALVEYPKEEKFINQLLGELSKIKQLHALVRGTNIDYIDRAKIIYNFYNFLEERNFFEYQ